MFIKFFSELNKANTAEAGGKGASLGELTQAGIPVPPGFVVVSGAFEQFLAATDLTQEIDALLHKVNHQEIHTVETASEQIKALILQAEMPDEIAQEITASFKKLNAPFVAVRSSATAEDSSAAAWAGQLESYLNTTETDLLDKVKHCWASLFTPRAIFYRFEKGLHSTTISVAVVVQAMVASEVSGIAFSVHPVTEDYNQLIIEAGFGLGEAIVSGQITPDSYVVEKEPRRIIDVNVATQEKALYRASMGGNEWRTIHEPQASSQVLSKEQILELSEVVLKIEKHYGFPCDIEWAYEAGKFYIVQSRPITTLAKKESAIERYRTSNPSDYIRMFAQKSFPYLFSNIFLGYYGALGVISITGEKHWISFFPKSLVKKTNEEGRELYTSKSVYKKYRKEFDDYVSDSTVYFKKVLQKDVVIPSDVEEFFQQVSRLFIHYSKTEFFYTDGVKPDEMAITVKEFDDLKLSGRAYLNSLFFEDNGYIKTLLKKISKQTSVPNEELLEYNIEELANLVTTGKRLTESELAERRRFFESKDLTLFGSRAQPLIEEFFSGYLGISKVIKGTIASRGRAKGRARVLIPDAKDFDKIAQAVEEMQEGEILIAETTSPDIIAACKKAAAIVTNQGGQLSHAAIVSRELGIPCIIGTDKDVILNIKTGDELEVDADQGVIRILK